jgi:hypothetical protein
MGVLHPVVSRKETPLSGAATVGRMRYVIGGIVVLLVWAYWSERDIRAGRVDDITAWGSAVTDR